LELTGALHFIVVLAGSYVVALVSYVVIEKPFLMLKLKSSQPSSIEIDAFYRGTEANVAPAATKK
jgi:peptidoglycan/LPS O-acetylase OafA/YrhL